MTDVNPEHSRIGKYEILSIIGTGGFGRVLKAHDAGMDRDVAIKVLNAENDPEILARFRTEAKITANFDHPNIVKVFEFVEDSGRPYLVMEFLDGSDLARIITQGPVLPILDKLRILLDACLGLRYAHERGIVHRDVKPANIMRLHDGTVKVMDFGVARITQAQTHRHTIAGFVVGSVPWMAPEQLDQQEADVQTDIWAFGVTAFEFITGVHPFRSQDRGNTGQLISLISQPDIPKLSRHLPEASPELVEIVSRCLQRERTLRYETMGDIAQDLRPLLQRERRARSAVLLRQVEREHSLDHTELALKLVREAIDLDPQSVQAREWRTRIQRENATRAQRQRVQDLLAQAESDAGAQRFSEAAEHLRAALQIQPDSLTLQSRLKEIQAAVERQQIQRIVARARELFLNYDLDGARLALARAAAIRAEDPDVVALLAEIAAEEERLARTQAAQSALLKAEGLLESGNFEEAAACAESALASLPDAPQSARACAELDRLLAEARWHLEGLAAIGWVRCLIEEEKIEDATSALNSLGKSWSAWPEAVALGEQLRQLRCDQERKASTALSVETANRAAALGDIAEAVRILESALDANGPDQALEGPLAEFRSQHRRNTAEVLRSGALQSAIASSTELEASGKLVEAAALIEKALATWGKDAGLTARLARLQHAVEEASLRSKRKVRLADGRADAERKSAVDLDGAISAVLALMAEFGTDPELRELLGSFQRRKTEDEARRERIAWAQIALDQARQRLAQSAPEDAAMILDGASAAGTGLEASFEELRLAIRREILRVRRLSSDREVLARVEELSGDGNLGEAIRVLEVAMEQSDPSSEIESRLQQLRQDLARNDADRQRREALQAALLRATELEEAGDWRGALAEAENALANFGADERLAGLAAHLREVIRRRDQERKRATEVRQTQNVCTRMAAAGDFEEALSQLARALAAFPDAPELLELQSALRVQLQAEEARRRRLQLIADTIREAERLANAGMWAEAIACAERTQAETNGGAELESLLARLQEGAAEAARGAEFVSLDADVGRPLEADEFTARFKRAYQTLGLDQELLQRELAALQILIPRLLKEKKPLDAARVLEESAGRHSTDPRHEDLSRKARVALARSASGRIKVPPAPSPPRDFRRLLRLSAVGMTILAIAAGLYFFWPESAQLRLRAGALSNATAGQSYTARLHAEFGSQPYRWSLRQGALPAGIGLDSATGRLSGSASDPGPHTFRVEVTDRQGTSAEATFSLFVESVPEQPPIKGIVAPPAVAPATQAKPSPLPSPPAPNVPSPQVAVPPERRPSEAPITGSAPVAPDSASRAPELPPRAKVGPCVAKPSAPAAVGSFPSYGTLVWSGLLEPGTDLVVCDNMPNTGRLDKKLYPQKVELRLQGAPGGIVITQPPDIRNGYGFVVRNGSKEAVRSLRFSWTLIKPADPE